MTNIKRFTKRGLSVFLVLVMCLSLLPTAAFATDNDADVQGQATPGDKASVQAFLDAVDSIEVPEEDLMLEENAELAESFGAEIWAANDLFEALTEEQQELEEVQQAYVELNLMADVITGGIEEAAYNPTVNISVNPGHDTGWCVPGVENHYGGSITKNKGDSGYYLRRAVKNFYGNTCGHFMGQSLAKEYANIQWEDETKGVIGDVSFGIETVGGYQYMAMYFTGLKAGTTKVELQYDVNFHSRWNYAVAGCPVCGATTTVDQYDDNWYHYSDYFYVTVTDSQQVGGAEHYFFVPANGAENGTVTFEMTNVEPISSSFEWCYVAKPTVIDPNGVIGTYVNVTPANNGVTNGGYTAGWNITISGITATPGTDPVTVQLKYYDSYCKKYKYDTLKIVVYEPETVTLQVGQSTDLPYNKDVSGKSIASQSPYGSVKSTGSGVISVQNLQGTGTYRVTGTKTGTDSSIADYGYWRYQGYGSYAYVSTWYLDVVKFKVVDELPDTTPVTIVKEFDGLTEGQIPDDFSLSYTVSGCDKHSNGQGTTLSRDDARLVNTNGTPSLVWNVDLPVVKHGTATHTITFSESNANVQGYKSPIIAGNTVMLESLTVEDNAKAAVITVTNRYEADKSMYVLSYDGMGGTNCPATQYVNIGNSENHEFDVAGNGNIPTNEGYTFLGWAWTEQASKADFTYDSITNSYSPAKTTLTREKPSKTLYAVWGGRSHVDPVNPKLIKLEKVRVTDKSECTSAPADVEYGTVIFRSDDQKVKLLYKITVTGTAGAAYKVTDEGAAWVSGGGNHETKNGTLTVTGTIAEDATTAVIYVTKEFDASAIEDGKLTNTANLVSNAPVDPSKPGEGGTEGPGSGEATDPGTGADEKRNVTINFKTDEGDTLQNSTIKDYDKGGDFDGISVNKPTTRKAAPRATTETIVIPWTIEKDGKTYVLDEVASKDALDALRKLDKVNENVVKDIIYSLDMKGTIGTDDQGKPNDTSDGTPDKYQVKVTFKVENGSWNDETTVDVVKYVEKKTDGTLNAEGTATLGDIIPSVGDKPKDDNFKAGSWDSTPTEKTTVDKDVTYTYTYAEVGKYTVTFDSQGGSEVDTQTVPEGGKATEPDKPTKENAVFAGWVKEGETEFYDFDTVLTGNIKLVAQWDEDNLVDPTVPEEQRPATGGDGIADKYQREVTFKVVNGYWNEGANNNADQKVVVTLKKDGAAAEDGTAALTAPGVGDKPASGYRAGSWDTDPATVTFNKDSAVEYTYTYARNGGTGGGGGGINIPDDDVPQNPDPGIDIPDPDVPLAPAPGLNSTDHFAYIIGYADGTVRPAGNITRAEVATIFFRLMTDEFRTENWASTNSFPDVADASLWYNNAVSTAAKAGLLKGREDGKFHPSDNITRAEFATIAARFLSNDEVTAQPFPDTVGHWAEQDIIRAVQAGWIKGNSDGTFRPDDPITRAEAMTMVNRMLDRVPDKDHMLSDMVTWPDNPENAWYYEAVQEATNSHDYERDELGITEIWTAMRENRNWAALETEWANAASGSNGSGDVADNLN